MSSIEFFEDGGWTGFRRLIVEREEPEAPQDGLSWWLSGAMLGSEPSRPIEPPARPPSAHYLFSVRFEPFQNLGDAYNLGGVRRALLGARLERCHRKYIRAIVAYKTPSDPAALKQLGEIRSSVARLAKLDRRSHRYQGAMTAAMEASGQWQQLTRSNAGAHKPLPLPRAEFRILDWIGDAPRALEVIKHAEAILASNGSEAQDDLKAGPETTLYGYDLPRLYELAVGRSFGLSRTGNKLNINDGAFFVLSAASVIGLDTSVSNVQSHYQKARKSGLWGVLSNP